MLDTNQNRNSLKKLIEKKTPYGSGLVNSLINKLPIELHIPGYNYCGPGTKLTKRLRRGDLGVNKLDDACKIHDIAYSRQQDLEERHKADQQLFENAKDRIYSSDASFGEKAAALGVAAVMKSKIKLGMGCSQKKIKRHRKTIKKIKKRGRGLKFNDLTKQAKKALKNKKFLNNVDAVKTAIKAVKKFKGRKQVKMARIIPVPKTGGFLPLIPIIAALGALGSLGGGAAAIAKTVNAAKEAKEQLQENQRHNQAMEAIAIGKEGKGLFLKPYKSGLGFFLNPSKMNFH